MADRIGVPVESLERLAGGDLSEVLLVRRPDGQLSVAKGNASSAAEAAMLRTMAAAGVPIPAVEAEYDDVLLIEYVENDGLFSARTWADIGDQIACLHARTGESFGWPVDFSIGTVQLDNREASVWPRFWGEQRLVSAVSVIDRPWRERVEHLVARLDDHLPASPAPALLHGDLWSGNMLVRDGHLAALIDPACYYGHHEVDLAMICLFGVPEDSFWDSYGALEPGWRNRRPIYQLFPALVHMRLFGTIYAPLVDRLLSEVGA
ncbi:MAG: fructosamine kinase family protein [Allosphingosinicella sp.]